MFKKWITNIVKGVLLDSPTIKNARMEDSQFGNPISDSGLNDRYLYDFRSNRNFGGNWTTPVTGGTVPIEANLGIVDGVNEADPSTIVLNEPDPKPVKVAIKPIDVLHELERKPKAFDLEMLNEKIEVLRLKEELITQTYAKREVSAMIERLDNRKLYPAYKEFFDQFDNTDDGKIERLCKKYELVMEISDIFIPDFPEDAIQIMKDYTGMVEKICDKKPKFYVIAEKEDFEYAYDKRDPILLAQSPFGFFYQILGAWDKELVLLSEL